MFECVFESVSEGERCSLQVRSGSVFARQCHRSLGSPSELPSERGLPTNLRRGTPGSARTVVQSTEQTGGGGARPAFRGARSQRARWREAVGDPAAVCTWPEPGRSSDAAAFVGPCAGPGTCAPFSAGAAPAEGPPDPSGVTEHVPT